MQSKLQKEKTFNISMKITANSDLPSHWQNSEYIKKMFLIRLEERGFKKIKIGVNNV
tara:strand:- start:114 stop:284 length:171 start_codon:yes stop_codon:yes gene_type:complete